MNAVTAIAAGQPERLPFELDPSIIHHIVYSQAGSLSKALIELIMNSIDAGASQIDLTVAQTGFRIADDGRGFRSRDEVLAWFGRFGTPHQEGDATFGRFRLGRGQIMAFAKTSWFSRLWRMDVDVQAQGYSYDLTTELAELHAGCRIDGLWYEALSQEDLRTLLLDLVDLVRFTAVPVHLNGKLITVTPAASKWMVETEDAWFTATKEGSVAIYNQGVLVRFDAGHIWGAGGIIVTKKAIALNVSRTEILRKTCEVWKRVAPVMKELCHQVAEVDDGRIDENARQRWAADILKGGEDMLLALQRPVITLVPGRHVAVADLFSASGWAGGRPLNVKPRQPLTIVEDSGVTAEAEAIQRQGMIGVIARVTLERFRCRDAEDFIDIFRSLSARSREAIAELGDTEGKELPAWTKRLPWHRRPNRWSDMALRGQTADVEFLPFEVVTSSFTQRFGVLDLKELRGPERRVWIALRWALTGYCAEVRHSILETARGVRFFGAGMQRTYLFEGGDDQMHILPGVSDTADGWTDGRRYIAINRMLLDRIVKEGAQALDAVWAVVDHELAHEGDSLEAGHDAAFFERHHDITVRGAALRGLYKEIFLRKWLQSYSGQSKRQNRAGMRNGVVDRLAQERRDRGEDLRGWAKGQDERADIPMPEAVPMSLLATLNAGYAQRGWGGAGIDLDRLRRAAAAAQAETAARRNAALRDEEERAQHLADNVAEWEVMEAIDILERIGAMAISLQIPPSVFVPAMLLATNTLSSDLDENWWGDWVETPPFQVADVPVEADPALYRVIPALAGLRGVEPKDIPIEDAIAERRRRIAAIIEMEAAEMAAMAEMSSHVEDPDGDAVEVEIVERFSPERWARTDEQEAADRDRRQAVVDQSMLLPAIDGIQVKTIKQEG